LIVKQALLLKSITFNPGPDRARAGIRQWLKKTKIGSRKIKLAQTYEKYDFPNTLRLHYNADSAWLPNIFPV